MRTILSALEILWYVTPFLVLLAIVFASYLFNLSFKLQKEQEKAITRLQRDLEAANKLSNNQYDEVMSWYLRHTKEIDSLLKIYKELNNQDGIFAKNIYMINNNIENISKRVEGISKVQLLETDKKINSELTPKPVSSHKSKNRTRDKRKDNVDKPTD